MCQNGIKGLLKLQFRQREMLRFVAAKNLFPRLGVAIICGVSVGMLV